MKWKPEFEKQLTFNNYDLWTQIGLKEHNHLEM